MTNKNYRFRLRPYFTGCKVSCTRCGHKTSNLYIDTWNEIHFPDYVGRCDRASCAYHYSPKDYFKDNREMRPRHDSLPYIHPTPVCSKPLPRMYCPKDLMERTLKDYSKNSLYTFLSSQLGEIAVRAAFARYKVGTTPKWDGATVFWQIDVNGNVRTGKIIKYGSDGHRMKSSDHSLVTWAHTLWRERPADFRITQCFFGECLLADSPHSKVYIVESEKTAIICSIFEPDYLWLATGGCNGCLNPQTSKVLKDREVILVPDLGMEDKWEEKRTMLTGMGIDARLFDMSLLRPTDEDRSRGLDIADFYLRSLSTDGSATAK